MENSQPGGKKSRLDKLIVIVRAIGWYTAPLMIFGAIIQFKLQDSFSIALSCFMAWLFVFWFLKFARWNLAEPAPSDPSLPNDKA